jgi:hypothetical protein
MPVGVEAALLGASLVVNLVIAVWLLERSEREGKKTGALILRHQ